MIEQPQYQKVSWKYVLHVDFHHILAFGPLHVEGELYRVRGSILTVKAGYAWDGASGPTLDTEDSMTAGLVHDVLYQAMREGNLRSVYRRQTDREFRRILKRDGMSWLRRWVWWLGVRVCGSQFTREES